MDLHENVIDFNKVCRLCLMEESVMSSIYNEQDKHSTTIPLPLRIMACVSININSVDGLPSHICTACLCQVDGWYKFKDLCETADAVLKKCINNEPVQVETITQIRSKAREIRQFFTSPHLVKMDGVDSALNQVNSVKKPVKNVENSDDNGVKLYSLLKFGSEHMSKSMKKAFLYVTRRQESESEGTKPKTSFATNGRSVDSDDEEVIEEEEETESAAINKTGSNFKNWDFSSDDDVSLLKKKENILQEKTKNLKKRQKKEESLCKVGETSVRYFRTVKMQTSRCQLGVYDEDVDEEDDDDEREGFVSELEVIQTEVEKDPGKKYFDKKKMRSRKTQTSKEGEAGGKKRFRVRPAVPSSCTLCDKVYKNSEILRQHMKSHHVTGTIECSSCKLTFTSLRSLKYHEQRKHSNMEPVPCTFCGKKFLDKKYLRIHENIHSQTNHFVCQFCGRKFIMKTNLTVHISRHHTKKSNDFICQICGKAFPFKLYLKKHFKTHTDHKPYQCVHCEARFRENTLLRKHVNSIHLKLRPFLCQYCHKTFTRSLYLREHMESQHLGIQKKVECSRCGESFQNRNRLRQHECTGRTEPA